MGMPGDAERLSEVDNVRTEAIADVTDVLSDLSSWQLAQPRWQRVLEILDALAAALAVGDVIALREATADLELIGPVRITRIGATPVVPAPPPVRERTNHLVHLLKDAADVAASSPPQRDDHGGSGDRRSTG